MRAFRRSSSSRRLTLLFGVVLLPPAFALVWLGATLLDQDRTMLAARGIKRREAAAETLTRALVQSMSEAERWLIEDVDGMPEGAVRVTQSPAGIHIFPSERVLPVPLQLPRDVLSEAQEGQVAGAPGRQARGPITASRER
jgi:hypothetical protein